MGRSVWRGLCCLACVAIASLAYSVSPALESELSYLQLVESNEKLRPQLVDVQLRVASLAMMEGERDLARKILIDATSSISALIGDKEFGRSEKKALRTLGGSEDVKYYLGDPHEQLFAFLYLGILDHQAGEYELARASFKSAQIADEGSRNEGYKSDCYLAFLLESIANLALDRRDLAEEGMQFAVNSYKVRKSVALVQSAMEAGCAKNYGGKITKKEGQRAGLLLEWVSAYAPGHLTISRDPVQAIEDSFSSAIASLESPEKKSVQESYLKTFRSSDGTDAPAAYLATTKDYVLEALNRDAVRAVDEAAVAFEQAVGRILAPETNLIVLTQAGLAPCKTRSGGHGESLHYRDYPKRLDRQVLLMENQGTGDIYYSSSHSNVAGEPFQASIGFQARTRGGRDMDEILASQAKTQDNLHTASDIVEQLPYGGLFALALDVTASTIHAEADTRGWNELPAEIWIATGSIPVGEYRYQSVGFNHFLDPVATTETSGSTRVDGIHKTVLLCGNPWREVR